MKCTVIKWQSTSLSSLSWAESWSRLPFNSSRPWQTETGYVNVNEQAEPAVHQQIKWTEDVTCWKWDAVLATQYNGFYTNTSVTVAAMQQQFTSDRSLKVASWQLQLSATYEKKCWSFFVFFSPTIDNNLPGKVATAHSLASFPLRLFRWFFFSF